jgi:hypothetical protein
LRRPATSRQQVFRQQGGLAGPGCQRFQQGPQWRCNGSAKYRRLLVQELQ